MMASMLDKMAFEEAWEKSLVGFAAGWGPRKWLRRSIEVYLQQPGGATELTRLQRLVCNCPLTYNDGVNMDRPHEESCPVVNPDWKHNIHPEIWQGHIISRQTNRIGELEDELRAIRQKVK